MLPRIYLRFLSGVVKHRLNIETRLLRSPGYTHDHHLGRVMVGDNVDNCTSKVAVTSHYFSTSPQINSKTRKRNPIRKRETILPSSKEVDTGIISDQSSPLRKRKRTKYITNPVDIVESLSVRQLSGPLSLPDLTFGHTRVRDDFYDVPCVDLAKKLLGHILVRRLEDGTVLKGRIVETECYLGGEDKASHSYNGRITDRNMPMYMKPGTSYVYLTYGMYHCFNISSQGPGAAVLLRALDPLHGTDEMFIRRKFKKQSPKKEETAKPRQPKALKTHELCNGPSKLCISFTIDKLTCNKQDLTIWDGMWVEKSEDNFEVHEHHIVTTHRIGIDSAGTEWAKKPLRFYLIDNKSISKRDRIKEKELRDIGQFLS